MDVTGGNFHPLSIIVANNEAAVLVNRFEYTTQDVPVDPHRDFAAKPSSAREPAFAYCRKSTSFAPDAAILFPGIGERQKQMFRHRNQRRGGISDVAG